MLSPPTIDLSLVNDSMPLTESQTDTIRATVPVVKVCYTFTIRHHNKD